MKIRWRSRELLSATFAMESSGERVMLIATENLNVWRRIVHAHKMPMLLPSVSMLLLACCFGCSGNMSHTGMNAHSAAQHAFAGGGRPSQCSAGCIQATMAIVREGLGLDPQSPEKQVDGGLNTLFESLTREGTAIGSTISPINASEAIEGLTEKSNAPVVLINKNGHIYVALGAIRVNDNLLCQVIHGDEPVCLFNKQTLMEGNFQTAWKLEKKKGVAVPIHVGAATVEIDRLRHNFGETFPAKPLECTFHLKNAGRKPVILDKPIMSCRCAIPDLTEKKELAPGEQLDLKVATTGDFLQKQSIGLAFYEKGSGKARQVSLTLIGSQRTQMEVTPTMLDFGLVAPGKPCSRTITLTEKPTDKFILQEVETGKLPMSHEIESTKNKDGLTTYRVRLELDVDEKWSGVCREELVLHTDSVVRPKITVPVAFCVQPPVRTIPSVISLGTVAINELREERVRFVSEKMGFGVLQVESHPDECSVTLDQKKSPPEMNVAIKVKKPGIWQGVIRVNMQTPSTKKTFDVKCVAYCRQ